VTTLGGNIRRGEGSPHEGRLDQRGDPHVWKSPDPTPSRRVTSPDCPDQSLADDVEEVTGETRSKRLGRVDRIGHRLTAKVVEVYPPYGGFPGGST